MQKNCLTFWKNFQLLLNLCSSLNSVMWMDLKKDFKKNILRNTMFLSIKVNKWKYPEKYWKILVFYKVVFPSYVTAYDIFCSKLCIFMVTHGNFPQTQNYIILRFNNMYISAKYIQNRNGNLKNITNKCIKNYALIYYNMYFIKVIVHNI